MRVRSVRAGRDRTLDPTSTALRYKPKATDKIRTLLITAETDEEQDILQDLYSQVLVSLSTLSGKKVLPYGPRTDVEEL